MSLFERLIREAQNAGDPRVRDDVEYDAKTLLTELKITNEQFLLILDILKYQ